MTFVKKNFKTLLLSILGLLLSPLNANAQDQDITLPPNNFQLDFLTVYYEFNSDNTITMAIKCSIPNQYFALGLGTSMADADVWVFELVGDEITANDYRGEYHTYPPIDTSVGGQNDLIRLGYEITPEYSLVKIKRVLDTGDAVNDKPIQSGPVDFIYATGSNRLLVYHNQRGLAQVVLVGPVEEEVVVINEEEIMALEETEVLIEGEEGTEWNFISEEAFNDTFSFICSVDPAFCLN